MFIFFFIIDQSQQENRAGDGEARDGMEHRDKDFPFLPSLAVARYAFKPDDQSARNCRGQFLLVKVPIEVRGLCDVQIITCTLRSAVYAYVGQPRPR